MSDKSNKVLIVDRNDLIRRFYESVLKSGHYEVMSAPDVARGLEVAADFKPRVVLADFMPQADFDNFTAQLREDADIGPMVIVSADDIRELSSYSGVYLRLSMPVKKDDLLFAVEGAVYGPVPVCGNCLGEYETGVRVDVLYRSEENLGKYPVWFNDVKSAGINLSHSMCPQHYKEALDSIE